MLTSLAMNHVHPTAVIADGVELGEGNTIGPYAVILAPARIGDGNWIGPHVVIGPPAEIRGIDHGVEVPGSVVGTGVVIGSRNVLREYTTIHQGHYATTVVGDDCYLMNKVYIGHDNDIGDGVTMASSVTLGGHIQVGPGANLGMAAVVHQRRLIGPGAMVGMGSVVTHDIPPYALAYGNPCRVHGANRVGLERIGVDDVTIRRTDGDYVAGRWGADLREGSQPVMIEAWNWWKSHAGEHA
jgi:UDP-N-acetylglucosamine acyltransferase